MVMNRHRHQGPERRRAPRVESRLPVTLTHEAGALAASTRDISESGAYCTLRRFIPLMTKLQIHLDLPGRLRSTRSTRIACQGVVVRVEPPKPIPRRSRYHLAIFFNDMGDGDRARIARYVHDHLHAAKPRGTRHR